MTRGKKAVYDGPLTSSVVARTSKVCGTGATHREPGPKHIRTLPTRRRTSKRHYRQHNSPTLIRENKTDPRSLSHSIPELLDLLSVRFFAPRGLPFSPQPQPRCSPAFRYWRTGGPTGRFYETEAPVTSVPPT